MYSIRFETSIGDDKHHRLKLVCRKLSNEPRMMNLFEYKISTNDVDLLAYHGYMPITKLQQRQKADTPQLFRKE